LAERRKHIEAQDTQIVLVHMGSPKQGHDFFKRYALDDLPQISDPGRALYRAFDLRRGRLSQLIGPRIWWRGLQAAILHKHGFGKIQGDGTQMPGSFLLHRGTIVRAFRHISAADRPDYEALAACPIAAVEQGA
jgi:hypothetical protein